MTRTHRTTTMWKLKIILHWLGRFAKLHMRSLGIWKKETQIVQDKKGKTI